MNAHSLSLLLSFLLLPFFVSAPVFAGAEAVSTASVSANAVAGAALQPSRREVLFAKAQNSALGFMVQDACDNTLMLARKIFPARPRRVLLYSGQFDPFHNSHHQELLGALNAGAFDMAVVAPSLKMIGLPPDAQSPFWLRMLVTAKGVQDIPQARPSSFILRRGVHGAPAAVRELRRMLGPSAALTLLMGSDNFKNIKSWDDVDDLLKNASLMVNVRSGDNMGKNPLSFLPQGLGRNYRLETPGLYKNPDNGHVIRFVSIPTEEISSYQTLQAAMARDHEKLKTMFNPAALALVENYYYPFVPAALNSLRFQVASKSHEAFKRIFGVEAGDKLVGDWRVALALACQRAADAETPARTAGLVYRAASGWPCGVNCYPKLYSQAVELGFDPAFAEVRKAAQTESGGALCSSHKYAQAPEKAAPFWKRPRFSPAAAQGADYAPAISPGRKVRVYVPLASGENDAVAAHGVLSPCVKASGEKICAEKLSREGAAKLVMDHFGGKGADVFVSATLSPAAAKKRAGPKGEVLAASVPAEALVFPSDPLFWASRDGNPAAFEHEVLAREIKPQWLERN